jgi:para-nitrobenzyl esterase
MKNEPIVSVASGRVRGRHVDTASGASLAVFLGIPYAAPPVGPLRWKAPQPLAPWDGVRDALAFGPDLPQAANARLRAAAQSEDGLYLNVWAPADAEPGSLPVMVWIHGGGFVGGSGSDLRSDGARMAARGIVVVSFNYRAGLFGFLAHPALSRESAQGVSGNYGLLDQLAALRWVQENIRAFGGDPARVTAFGVSAGSASISLLLGSPLAQGLFQQAILHSPGAGRPLSTLKDAEQAGRALGEDIAALRELSTAELFEKTSLLNPKVRGLTTPRVLRPIRDGWAIVEDERPAFEAGRLHAMPVIVGSNADEGTLLTKTWPVKTIADYEQLLRANFGAASAEAAALYPVTTDADAPVRVAEMFADTQFNFGTRLIARAMARKGQPTWRYLFTRRAPGQPDGPHHGEEVPYVFGNLEAVPAGKDSAVDAAVSTAMMDAWIAFARTGDPNPSGSTAWPPFAPEADNFVVFGDRVSTGSGWRAAQLDFLERFFAG